MKNNKWNDKEHREPYIASNDIENGSGDLSTDDSNGQANSHELDDLGSAMQDGTESNDLENGLLDYGQQDYVMEMPIFPLNTVLFPGMVLPLHIFEPRYLEMVNRCIDEGSPFGVVLIADGQEVGAAAEPHMIGTAARIRRVEHTDDGRMNIAVIGTQRFRIVELIHTHSYLSAKVRHFPVVNGRTRLANEMVHRVRPKIVEYVELLAEASQTDLQLDRLPDDATTLAFLVGIALQVDNQEKQTLLELPGIPEMLDRERYLLSLEILLLKHMVETQPDIEQISGGPTGYIFPN